MTDRRVTINGDDYLLRTHPPDPPVFRGGVNIWVAQLTPDDWKRLHGASGKGKTESEAIAEAYRLLGAEPPR